MKTRIVLYGGSSIVIETGEGEEDESILEVLPGDESVPVVEDSPDSSVGGDSSVVDVSDIPAVVLQPADSRPFFTTGFDEYNVTEGMLLIVVVILAMTFLLSLVRRR